MYHPRFKGEHYDIGLKYGGLLKRNQSELFGLTELNAFQFDYGTQSESFLRKYFPEACDEIRGMADGLGIAYDRLAAWLMCISVCLEIPGCSMIAFKQKDRVVFGRNNDLPPIFRKLSSSALYQPSQGYAFIANSSAFVSAEEGINENGLAVGMTYVWAKKLAAGFNSMFLVRYILENCADVEAGIEAVQNIPIGGAYHLILADKQNIVQAECSPQKILIRRCAYAFATNHFITEEMKAFEENKNLFRSYERYQTACAAKARVCKDKLVDHTKDILGGKLGFMCQYEKEMNFDTVWSSIFDISNNAVYRAEGNPARCQYKRDKRYESVYSERQKGQVEI